MKQDASEKVAAIVRDAGGRIVGRTKLQKIAYILRASGLDDGFDFDYHHYGPYSEELAEAVRDAVLLGAMSEKESRTAWGGFYSTYETEAVIAEDNSVRSKLAHIGASADSVELELAATALFLAKEKNDDPWAETARRKPEKAENGRLNGAKELYATLRKIQTPHPLPLI